MSILFKSSNCILIENYIIVSVNLKRTTVLYKPPIFLVMFCIAKAG